MKLQRRSFMKAVPGVAAGLANCTMAMGQSSSGELRAASGSLHLEGKLKSVSLTLDAQNFLDRAERAVTVRGRLDSTDLYSAMFSYEKDLTVFALFHDNDHSTTVVLTESETAKIGRLVAWNDNQIPQVFDLDKDKVMKANDPKDIMDVKGDRPNLVGNRNGAKFTWQELESVFGSTPALLEFMRCNKSTHHPREEDRLAEWMCHLLSMIPGSMLSLFWRGY
jgi:hypothetical protein